MNTITEELVTLDINGRTVDCYVWGRYYPAYDGGRDEPSEPENYDLGDLFADDDGDQVEISGMLGIKSVCEDIIKQLKGNAKCN